MVEQGQLLPCYALGVVTWYNEFKVGRRQPGFFWEFSGLEREVAKRKESHTFGNFESQNMYILGMERKTEESEQQQ